MEKIEVFSKACEILEEQGYEASVYSNYPGRGMFGATCPGIVTDAPGPMVGFAIMAALVEEMGDDANDVGKDYIPLAQDSMGLSKIYY